MRSTMTTRALAGLVGLVLLVGACGSDSKSSGSSSSSSSSSALSKEEFLKQGNAICDAGNKELATAEQALTSSGAQPDPAAMKAFLENSLIPSVTRQVDGIDKLDPPKDLEAAVDKLVKDAKAALVKLKALAESDPANVFAGSDPFEDVNKQANAIGLTACGADSSEGSSDSSS